MFIFNRTGHRHVSAAFRIGTRRSSCSAANRAVKPMSLDRATRSVAVMMISGQALAPWAVPSMGVENASHGCIS